MAGNTVASLSEDDDGDTNAAWTQQNLLSLGNTLLAHHKHSLLT